MTTEKTIKETPKEAPETKKLPGKWFQKIPSEILLSPGGIVLIFFTLIIEIIDLIPIPVIDQKWELPLEIIFMILLVLIAKTSLKSMIVPFIIERVPGINDIVPTWFIRMFL